MSQFASHPISHSIHQEHHLLKDLPPLLRRDVAIFQFQKLVRQEKEDGGIASPMLASLSALLRREILARLTLVVAAKGEILFRYGEYAVRVGNLQGH